MTTNVRSHVEGTDVEPRTERAMTEYLTVLYDVDRVRGADDLYLVVSQSGSEYLVDSRQSRCTCPDHEYRDVRCKHLRRVAFATGEIPIPADVDGVDPSIGEHTDARPVVAVADGGVQVTGADGEAVDNDADRPADCMCTGSRLERQGCLPCFPCYREGFESPNIAADE